MCLLSAVVLIFTDTCCNETFKHLFVSGWVSISPFDPPAMKVQLGEEATLLCRNISKSDTVTLWFRLVKQTDARCISSMTRSYSSAQYCEGFTKDNFDMKSNETFMILKIKPVTLSDSGLYFCGYYPDGRLIFDVIYLNIEGKFCFCLYIEMCYLIPDTIKMSSNIFKI